LVDDNAVIASVLLLNRIHTILLSSSVLLSANGAKIKELYIMIMVGRSVSPVVIAK
jgi:hypothetical protein